MRLGKMRYRAEFQRFKGSSDKDGFVSKEWETAFVCWADVTAVSSREYLAADTETAETTVKIFVRFNADIDNKMRVKVGKFIYEINSVLHDPRGGITTVMAKEWDNGETSGDTSRGYDEKAERSGTGI